jgi:hypothetical protein
VELEAALCLTRRVKAYPLSCRKFRNNEVRLQLHALVYSLANFMRALALPTEMEHWSLTTIREKLVKIVAVPRDLFRGILELIDRLRRPSAAMT